jgi:hypothetical protein
MTKKHIYKFYILLADLYKEYVYCFSMLSPNWKDNRSYIHTNQEFLQLLVYHDPKLFQYQLFCRTRLHKNHIYALDRAIQKTHFLYLQYVFLKK